MSRTIRNRVSFTAGLKQGNQQGAQADVSRTALCSALWEWAVTGCNGLHSLPAVLFEN